MQKPLVEQASTIARINVTPIIDVALVLVIILLITAPMISAANMEIDLPKAHTRSLEDDVRISVTIGKDGEVALDDEVLAPGALVSALATRLEDSKDENVLVVVRADATTSYDSVNAVLKDVRRAGANRIAIATQQRGRER